MSTLNENKIEVEILHMIEDIKKMSVETNKMHSETKKINRETVFYPFVAGAGVTVAILTILLAVGKIFLN